jgi:hypothetical protein
LAEDQEASRAKDELAAMLASITAWRSDRTRPLPCPSCGRPGLEVIDRSTPPWAEWYALRCAACGLDRTLQIPMRPPSSGPD